MSEQTYGQKIIRAGFNPSEKADVKEAKRLVAELIDFTRAFVPALNSVVASEVAIVVEEERLLEKAIDCFEEGAMWLVKGLTVDQSK